MQVQTEFQVENTINLPLRECTEKFEKNSPHVVIFDADCSRSKQIAASTSRKPSTGRASELAAELEETIRERKAERRQRSSEARNEGEREDRRGRQPRREREVSHLRRDRDDRREEIRSPRARRHSREEIQGERDDRSPRSPRARVQRDEWSPRPRARARVGQYVERDRGEARRFVPRRARINEATDDVFYRDVAQEFDEIMQRLRASLADAERLSQLLQAVSERQVRPLDEGTEGSTRPFLAGAFQERYAGPYTPSAPDATDAR